MRNGFLIESNNIEELINAMKNSMLDKKLLQEKANRSKRDSKKFSLRKMIRDHSNLYNKLITK